MADDANPSFEIEFSSLCRTVTRDGETIRVNIYRIPEVQDQWTLEVVDRNGATAVWDDLFESDDDALQAFDAALAVTGIDGLTETFH